MRDNECGILLSLNQIQLFFSNQYLKFFIKHRKNEIKSIIHVLHAKTWQRHETTLVSKCKTQVVKEGKEEKRLLSRT
jgi:hypothetical protein